MLRVAFRKLAAPAAAAAGVATAGGAVHAQEERRRPAAGARDGACSGDAARCSAAAASPAEAAIPLWQTAANLVAANPFKSVFGVAAPLYAAIFAYECSSPATKDLPLSQRLIHTRVYGQAIAIGATIAVMAVLNAQEKRGGLPYGQTEAKPKQSELTRLYDGTMRRASGSSSLPQGLHDRQAWAADNVDNYGLKMEQAQAKRDFGSRSLSDGLG